MSGPPPDPSRRRFFRQFAGEVVSSAAQLVGAVAEVRDRSAAEAQALLRGDTTDGGRPRRAGRERGGSQRSPPEPPTGFRTPFRFAEADDHLLLVIDQRKLPDELVEMLDPQRLRRGAGHPRDVGPRRAGDRPGGRALARAQRLARPQRAPAIPGRTASGRPRSTSPRPARRR